MNSVSWLKYSSNLIYNNNAFDYLSRMKASIHQVADIVGISPGAIGGAMAEENSAYGSMDVILDYYAKNNLIPSKSSMISLSASSFFGSMMSVLWPSIGDPLFKTRSHDQWIELYKYAKNILNAPSALDKFVNPALFDAGLANVKIATAIDMVNKHAEKPAYSALNLTPYLKNYSKLVEDLMSKNNDLTVKIYGLYMKEHADLFFRSHKAYGDQWDNLPLAFKDALLVTYTNMGEAKLLSLMDKTKNTYEPQPGLMTGGGANHLLNAKDIAYALGLVGYDNGISSVENLISQAKKSGESGLAARYALLNLRYVAINYLDYSDVNVNRALEIYDRDTDKGAITEQYIHDRSAMLSWILKQLKGSTNIAGKPLDGSQDVHFYDMTSGKNVHVKNKGAIERLVGFGTKSNDQLYGGVKDDRLYGAGGNDTLGGRNGNDYLEGGAGDDALWGDDGNDTLEGGAGKDTLGGDEGNDVILGRGGDDFLLDGIGNDTLIGGTGDDYLISGEGNDILIGDRGDDYLNGNEGSDTLVGGEGNDYLIVNGGNHICYGGDGNDTLNAWGAGKHLLLGGAGYDHYLVQDGDTILDSDGLGYCSIFWGGSGLPDKVIYKVYGNDFFVTWGNQAVRIINGFSQALTHQGWLDITIDIQTDIVMPADVELINWALQDIFKLEEGLKLEETLKEEDFYRPEYSGKDTITSDVGGNIIQGGIGNEIQDYMPINSLITLEAPSIIKPTLVLMEDRIHSTVVMTLDMFGLRDADSNPDRVIIAASNVSGGSFRMWNLMGEYTEVTIFTAEEVIAGQIHFVHDVNTGLPSFSVSAWDDTGLSSGVPIAAQVHFTPAAYVIFGDASGSGAGAGYSSLNGGNGGGGNDTLEGTAFSDLIFGDGSGGGEGQRTGSGGNNSGHGGLAGSGNDAISGGGGDDLIFGDGFAGGEVTAGLGLGGAGGYGGGGSGSGNNYASVGGGAGSVDVVTGGYSTLGPFADGGATVYNNGQMRGGAGAGVGTYASTASGRDGGHEQILDVLPHYVYYRVLSDLNDRMSDIYTQTMGTGADTLNGGAGNDWIMAGGGNDILIGGTGNDTLDGGAGDDIYRFNAGDGEDVIQQRANSGHDILELGAGLDAANMQLQRSGKDLILSWASGESITVRDYFQYLLPASRQGMSVITDTLTLAFADGSQWHTADIQEHLGVVRFGDASGSGGAAGYISLNGGDGGGDDDVLNGTAQADILFGDGSGGGEGQRTGSGGSNAGRGGLAGSGNDTINGGAGNDLIFGDGFAGENVLSGLGRGGAGGYGGGGSGSGNSFASIGGGAGGTGQGPAATPGQGASLGPEAAGGNVIYNNGVNRGGAGAGVGTAADGGAGKNGNTDQITETLDNSVYERVLADLNNPDSALHKQSMGTGNDVLNGGAGNDWIMAGGGNDTLDGGTGNDTLYGGLGNDTYIFGNGAGADVIRDQDATPGNQDQLLIGPDVAADQLWFRQLGMDLELSIIGSSDKATISNWFAGSEFQIERFQLSSGQALINQQVDSLIQAMAAFAPPAPGQTSLPADYHNALTPVIAANWQ